MSRIKKVLWNLVIFSITLGIALILNWSANSFFGPFRMKLDYFLSILVLIIALPVVLTVKELRDEVVEKKEDVESTSESFQATKEILSTENVASKARQYSSRTFLFLLFYLVGFYGLPSNTSDLMTEFFTKIVTASGFAFVLYNFIR